MMKVKKRLAAATLYEKDVWNIKCRLAEGKTPRELAEVYGVGIETIRRINREETWAWVKGPPEPGELEKPLPPEEEAAIERMRLEFLAEREREAKGLPIRDPFKNCKSEKEFQMMEIIYGPREEFGYPPAGRDEEGA